MSLIDDGVGEIQKQKLPNDSATNVAPKTGEDTESTQISFALPASIYSEHRVYAPTPALHSDETLRIVYLGRS